MSGVYGFAFMLASLTFAGVMAVTYITNPVDAAFLTFAAVLFGVMTFVAVLRRIVDRG